MKHYLQHRTPEGDFVTVRTDEPMTILIGNLNGELGVQIHYGIVESDALLDKNADVMITSYNGIDENPFE